MSKQIELAKSILEAAGYTVTKMRENRFEVVFKDPDETYQNFLRASAGYSGDVNLSTPIKLGVVTYQRTDDVVDQLFQQAARVYSFKTVEDVIAALRRVLRGWDVNESDKEFVSLYNSALEKLDYVLGTNFQSNYEV